MNRTSMRTQLTRVFMLIALVAFALNACLIVAYEFMRYREDAVGELHTQETILAKALVPSLVFNDPDAAAQQLASLAERSDILAASVFGANGRPFAQYPLRPGAADLPRPGGLPESGVRFTGDELEMSHDIFHDGERVGTLYLRAHHGVLQRLASYAAIQGLVMALSLALALVAFGRVRHRIVEPIARVSRVAETVISARDWKLRAPAADTREIDVLVTAFNGMLAEMEANSLELRREVAERHRAEEGLRAADRRKDEFLATLAHEIRNPLAPMMNALSLLRRDETPARIREKAIAILDRQLRHVVRLIDDLLDVSRITTGKLSLQVSHVDLNQVLRSALESIEPVARARRQALEAAVPEGSSWVIGDSARLIQVFSNLLGNACRYTPEGGRISVTTHPHAHGIRVDVADTGVGIEPEFHERVFDLFEQGDKSLERGNTGLGIGLTLARQLVLLHGGSLSVASEGIGRGSTFSVELPTAASAPPPAAAPAPVVDLSSLNGVRVLVADDNIDFAGSLQVALEAAGMDVRAVNDGRAALATAHAFEPAFAILDIGMPGLNGYDLARALRADSVTAGIVLFAVSGWGQASDRSLASQAGFDRHFVKPVTPEVLLEAIAEAGARGPRPAAGETDET